LLVLIIAAESYSHGVTDEISACFSIIIPHFALRQVHKFFQKDFSKHFDLVLPPSASSIFSMPYGHSVAAYVFFIFPSRLSFLYLS